MEKAGHICLTTIENAFQHSTSSFSTECPSCGLRLIIRYNRLANRASSMAAIIGISALIGYHLGANHDNWIRRFNEKLLKFFNFSTDDDDDDHSNSKPLKHLRQSQTAQDLRKILRNYDQHYHQQQQPQTQSQSEHDSAFIDNESIASDDHDSLSLSNNIGDDNYHFDDYYYYYDHNYNDNDDHKLTSTTLTTAPLNKFYYQSHTVDKIDQILHQIDDIKKSIVEIDDELYQITGSKFACFNPDFLQLSNINIDDDIINDNNLNNKAITLKIKNEKHSNRIGDNNLQSRKPLITNTEQPPPQQSNQSFEPLMIFDDEPIESLINDQIMPAATSSMTDDHQPRRESTQSIQSIESNYSANFSSFNLNQLEWDEIECDYCSFKGHHDQPMDASSSSIPSIDKSEDDEQHQQSQPENKSMMTDEQKLRSMQDLFEEAKRLGLLNNIIDAFLNDNSNNMTMKLIRKSKSKSKSRSLEKFSKIDEQL